MGAGKAQGKDEENNEPSGNPAKHRVSRGLYNNCIDEFQKLSPSVYRATQKCIKVEKKLSARGASSRTH
jgi:hypothetical protein